MDGPWPDVSSAIAGMDDAGLDVPATRIGKARDTVAALEGVTLPSAVDQVRRDTLKAMVGIYAGEKLPRDYARKARNKAMLDFMAASPALRESMLADQIGLLMDGISDNGKRAVGAYTALKGKIKGIEAMNLPRLYDLKRELEGDVNMGERQRRNFAILVDNEIENSTYRGDTPRAEDAREAARKSKWGPVRLDGERPVDGDAMARLMEDYPNLFDGGVPSGELNGWLLSRDGMVSRVQEAEARLKEVEATEAKARAAGEHVSDSPLYGSAGAKRALANAKGVLEEQDARILKRARELGLIHENREGVTWLPGVATPGVDSEPEGVSAIPFDAEGNVDTGRLRVNRYYRRKDDGSVWYWTGKEMVDTRQKLETSDIVVENGRIARDLLVEGEIYEVEDGTRFVWDGEYFREVPRLDEPADEGRTYMPRSDPADKRVSGHPGVAATPREFMDAAEAIRRETGSFGVQAGRVRVLAIELAGVQDRLRNYRLNGLPESDYRVKAARERLADGMPKLRSMYGDLVNAAKPEAVSIEKMAGRINWPGPKRNVMYAVIRGAGGNALNVPETAVIEFFKEHYRLMKSFQRLDEGANVADILRPGLFGGVKVPGVRGLPPGMVQDDPLRPNLLPTGTIDQMQDRLGAFIKANKNLTPGKFMREFSVSFRKELTGGVDLIDLLTAAYALSGKETRMKIRAALTLGPVRENRAMQGIQDARDSMDENFASNPRFEDSFWLDSLPEGVGALVPAIAMALLLKKKGVSFTAVGALDAAMAEGVKSFHASLNNNESIEEAFEKHELGMWLGGAVELIPIPRILSKAGDKSISNILLRAVEQGGGAVGKEELLKQISRALNNSPEVSHDPDADTFKTTLDGKDVTFSKKALEYVLAVMTGLE